MIPLMINEKRANEIIECQKPRRTFLFIKDGLWVGIDNRKGDMETKTFSSVKGCMNWLKGNTKK